MPLKPILRRVKPDVYDDSEEEEEEGADNRSNDGSERDDDVMGGYSDEDSDRQDDGDDNDEEEDKEMDIDAKTILAETSFGILAQAESSLSRNRNHSRNVNPSSTTKEPFSSSSTSKPSITKEDRLSAIKSKLSALNLPKSKKSTSTSNTTTTTHNPTPNHLLPPHPQIKPKSKSTPAEQSSKKPVSRFREAIEINTPKSRDPRFDSNSSSSAAAATLNETQFKKNYAFLNEYRESEITALKEKIVKARRNGKKGGKGQGREVLGEEEVLEMERMLKRMESQKQTQEAKDRSAALVAEHKKKERELIKQGKTPYFLKRSEQKKMVLVDKYSKLGEKELDRVLARRRKQKAAKEKRNMPWARRGTEA